MAPLRPLPLDLREARRVRARSRYATLSTADERAGAGFARRFHVAEHFLHERVGVFGGLGRGRGEAAHLVCDHGEPLSLLAGARRLHRGVEREQLRLARDFLHQRHELAHLVRGARERFRRARARAHVVRELFQAARALVETLVIFRRERAQGALRSMPSCAPAVTALA